jgi:SET and MYND domain-containing protein
LPTTPQLEKLPVGLSCVLREDYISGLSEEFSKASHEGDYAVALNAGLTLLALYVVVYPPNYPQIGKFWLVDLHFLLMKTTRNAPAGADQIGVERTILGRHK